MTNPTPSPEFPLPGLGARLKRHLRLSRAARVGPAAGTPPLLVLFVNSICNLTCEHCFYWRNLNQRDDLTFDELAALSRDLGTVENLNLSGGEPFLRKELDRIVRMFVRDNGTRQIYVPTNGWYTERTVAALASILEEPALQLFACELSLDGTEAYHDAFRGKAGSFRRALETYDALAELQRRDPRLRIHSISTVTDHNVDEVRALSDHLHERCPAMDHHNIAVIRGDNKHHDVGDLPEALAEHVRVGLGLDFTRGRHQRHQVLLGHLARLHGDHVLVRLLDAHHHHDGQDCNHAYNDGNLFPLLHRRFLCLPLHRETAFALL